MVVNAQAHVGGNIKMRTTLTIIIIVLTFIRGYSIDTLNTRLFNHAQKAPLTDNLDQLVDYLTRPAKNDQEKIETFFYWIALNIKYDKELYDNPDMTESDVSVEKVLATKKTICSGYSNLMRAMCSRTAIECKVIDGFVQYYLEKRADSLTINHAWNAIKIDNEWILTDMTWGSGGFVLGSVEYTMNMDLRYLFADADFMLIDHFPTDDKWQLQDKPLTFDTFQNNDFHEMRFRKFNDLLDDKQYQQHLEIMKQFEKN